MNVSVYGKNQNALVFAGSLAAAGNKVLLCAEQSYKVAQLAELTGNEPLLAELVHEQIAKNNLQLAKSLADGGEHGEIHILSCTPHNFAEAQKIAALVGQNSSGKVIFVNKTNFEIGASEQLLSTIHQSGNKSCVLAVEPTFLISGQALIDFKNPNRILLGTDSDYAAEQLRQLYKPFIKENCEVIRCSPKAAELTKAATNAMIATRISFINEIANLADHFGIDVEQVRQGLGADSRIGKQYLSPGAGFGGPNFASDVATLNETLKKAGTGSELLTTVLEINNNQKDILFQKAWRYYHGDISNKTFGFWGVTYKPKTNNCENSHSLELAKLLLNHNTKIKVYDPSGKNNFWQLLQADDLISDKLLSNIQFCESALQAVQTVDAVFLNTEWQEFFNLDLHKVKSAMRNPVIFDGRNIFDPAEMQARGFRYEGVGRRVS